VPPPSRVHTLHIGGAPTGLAVGDGSVWVADYGAHRMVRLDPSRNRVIARIPLDGSPYDAAFGHGALWVSSFDRQHVWRIDPATNRVVAAIDIGSAQQSGLTVAADGVWVAAFGSGKVVRIDSATNAVTGDIVVGGNPEAVESASGSLWIPNENGTMARVDPGAMAVVGNVKVGSDPDYAVFCHGRLWVSDLRGSRLSVVDPRTRTVVASPRVGVGSAGLACGGSVWSVNYDDGSLVELDSVTARVLGRRKLGAQLRDIVVFGRDLWVCDQAAGAVVRLRTR
jgi:DNA-binding beta-propeller fold protein YncE